MKNNIVIIFILSISSLSAQEDYGLRNVAGGQFSLNFAKESGGSTIDELPSGIFNDPPDRIIDIQPYAAWKIKRNMLLGLRLGFRQEMVVGTSSSAGGVRWKEKNYFNTYTVGVFSRHCLSPERAFRFFLEPYLSYSRAVSKEDDGNGDKERNYFFDNYRLTISPGVTYQLSQHFGLVAKLGQVGVQSGKIDNGNGLEDWYKEFFADFNLASFSLGVEYRF